MSRVNTALVVVREMIEGLGCSVSFQVSISTAISSVHRTSQTSIIEEPFCSDHPVTTGTAYTAHLIWSPALVVVSLIVSIFSLAFSLS